MPCTACVVESAPGRESPRQGKPPAGKAPGRESPRQGGVPGWSPWMCLLREQTLSVAPLRNKMPKRRYTAQTRYLYDKLESQPRNKPRGVAGIIIGVCGADVHLAGIGARTLEVPRGSCLHGVQLAAVHTLVCVAISHRGIEADCALVVAFPRVDPRPHRTHTHAAHTHAHTHMHAPYA